MNPVTFISWLQAVIGVAVMLSGLVILIAGVDGDTKRTTRWPLIGMVGWGAYFALSPWAAGPDSLPGLAFAALVAYVLVRHGRQVRGIIDGEDWWPPNARRPLEVCVTMWKRRDIAPGSWRNPFWLFFGNEDDGVYGDKAFNPEGRRDWRTALRWWLRNPAHNLTFYVIGVAHLDRVVEGPWAPAIHNPDGGWLRCRTHVVRGGRPRVYPFVSYDGKRLRFYAGWRPGGAFGLKLQRRGGAS